MSNIVQFHDFMLNKKTNSDRNIKKKLKRSEQKKKPNFSNRFIKKKQNISMEENNNESFERKFRKEYRNSEKSPTATTPSKRSFVNLSMNTNEIESILNLKVHHSRNGSLCNNGLTFDKFIQNYNSFLGFFEKDFLEKNHFEPEELYSFLKYINKYLNA